MKLASLAPSFLRYREVLGRAPKTVQLEREALARLLGYLRAGDVDDVEQLTRNAVLGFQEDLAAALTARGTSLQPQTQRGYLIAVRHFLRWLDQEGYTGVDLARVLVLPKREQPLPKELIERGEMRKLLQAPDVTSVLGFRDRAMLEVLWSTGVRVSELAAIRVGDVDLDGGSVRVERGKGGWTRIVPMGAMACALVGEYVERVRPELVRDPDVAALFVSRTGKPLEKTAIEWRVRQYARRAGIRKKITPHCFRVTCTTGMLRNGARERILQEMLGHRRLETLAPYTRLTINDLKAAHARFHPRERMEE